jgi:hypothetical protein
LNLAGLDQASGGDRQDGAFLAPGPVVFVADFDVDRSFVLQGGPDEPGGFSRATFTPTVRLSLADVAGSISGRVTTSLPDVAVGGLVVAATPLIGASLEPSQTDEATAVTDDGGAFSMSFLMPGDYEISVEADEELGAEPVRVTVPPRGAVTEVALVLVES